MGISHDNEFAKLVDQFTQFVLRSNPVSASFLGVHDHDELFSDYAPAVLKNQRARRSKFYKEFKAINKRALNTDNRVDLELILTHLELEDILEKKYPARKINPDHYLREVLFGIYVLLSREFAPDRERALSITRRLAGIPTLLRQARNTLDKPAAIFVESAIHTCAGAINFLTTAIPEFTVNIHGSLKDALLEANSEAVTELTSFGQDLETVYLPTAKANFPTGKILYNQILKLKHEIPYNSDQLLKIAKKEIRQITQEMDKLAGKIAKGKDRQQVVESLKKEHPIASRLVASYQKEMLRARNYVKDHDLVTMPDSEEIKVVPTPPFATGLIPYAAYLSPGPLESVQEGIFWVTVPEAPTKKELAERLKGHSKWGIAVTALHEAYPGHHLQHIVANQSTSLVRQLFTTPVFAEGWAFYCEDMMWEQGFYSDPKERLLQLKDALWRAWRVVIDVELHTKKMTVEQAVQTLVEKAGLETPNAEAEVRRYCQTPTQPMSYYIGKIEINKLLEAYRKKRNKEFSLKTFHDELLAHGTIPFAKVSTLMELS